MTPQQAISIIEENASSITAIAAVLAALIAVWSVVENRRHRHAQISPQVVVYLERNERFTNSLDLIIRNIGAAPAYEVTFENPGTPIPFGWWKQDEIYVLSNGINFLPVGKVFRFSIDEYKNMPKDEVTISVCYFATRKAWYRRRRCESFTLRPLEFGSFAEWTDREKEAQKATKAAMDELRKTMSAFRSGRITVGVKQVVSVEHERRPISDEAWKQFEASYDLPELRRRTAMPRPRRLAKMRPLKWHQSTPRH